MIRGFDEYKMDFESFAEPALARGGQKVVYRAVHRVYGDVVVKVLFSQDERSEREINIVMENSFDCVPAIFDVQTIVYEGQETKAIVEEYIEGESLRDVIASGKRFSLSEASAFLEKSLRFLEQISARGIVHRDIKPENIILSNGTPMFLDFGIARIIGAESLTKTGFGGPNTPGYASPEQFLGQKDRIDGRADLFSIGVVTYELVTGTNPFVANASSTYQIYQNTVTITPISYRIPGDTQLQFMGLLSSMMSRQIAARPRDAHQALLWLEDARRTFACEDDAR